MNTAIYVDMEDRNNTEPPATNSMADTGINEIILLHGIQDTQPLDVWHALLRGNPKQTWRVPIKD